MGMHKRKRMEKEEGRREDDINVEWDKIKEEKRVMYEETRRPDWDGEKRRMEKEIRGRTDTDIQAYEKVTE